MRSVFFNAGNQGVQEEEKLDQEAHPNAPDPQPVAQPLANQGAQNIPKHGALEVMDAAVEEAERGRKNCCSCCLVQ